MENNGAKRIGFWKRLKMSIFNVENYDIFAVENFSKALGYFVKLMIVFSLLVAGSLTYRFSKMYTSTIDILKNEIPDFQYAQGNLKINSEEPIIIENEDTILPTIIIDDTENIEEQEKHKEEIKKTPSGCLFLKNGVFINLTNQEELIYYNYEEVMKQLGTEEFTKEQMLRYINTIDAFSLYGAFYLSSTIYLFSTYIIFTFSDVLLLSILGFFTARIAKMKLKYMPIINIAVYSITLSVLLNAIYMIINILTGFEIEYFRIMYNAIAYIYVVTAILMIRAEMIKQQIEFAKLIEEQKKVKEELEQKQREKEDEKEKQKEEKPKDKQKEKKDEKNENDGVADGSSAV